MKIFKAGIENLEQLLRLFEGYRKFYKQTPNPDAAREFLKERIIKKESIIFLAFNNKEEAIGFTQLYPSFSSVSMQKLFVLNDIYVVTEQRGNKVGEKLLQHAKQFIIDNNYKGLTLETDINNPAQKLYERLGWKKDNNVFHYTWTNN